MTKYKVFLGNKYIGIMTPSAFINYSLIHPMAWKQKIVGGIIE